MASLLLIGGILLAAKYADDHVEKKNREVGPDSDNYSQLTVTSKTSKRDRLKPRNWRSRRKTRDVCESSPPPYAELPAYRELERMDDPVELEGSEVSLTVHEAPGTPHEERCIKDRLPELA